MAEAVHRSGLVAILGRPNAGKSTLLNQLLGEKLAIVTAKPQTTRSRILGILTLEGAQLLLLDHLDIARLHASVGASLGGMQSLMLAALAPERVDRIVSISAAACSHPQSIAMRFVQRQAVMADPDWREGRYYGQSFPHRGLRVAREMGTLTYRSGPEWMEGFGRARNEGPPRLTEDFRARHGVTPTVECFEGDLGPREMTGTWSPAGTGW